MKWNSLFTLIELLLVISIIAILVGMLLPVLNRVKEKSHIISCLNNEKQIGVGFVSYGNDFSGWGPAGSFYKIDGQYGGASEHWLYLLGKGTAPANKPYALMGYLPWMWDSAYEVKKIAKGIMHCPTEKETLVKSWMPVADYMIGPAVAAAESGHFIKGKNGSANVLLFVKMESIKRPSLLGWCGDSADSEYRGLYKLRHSGFSGNFLFYDLHAALVKRAEINPAYLNLINLSRGNTYPLNGREF